MGRRGNDEGDGVDHEGSKSTRGAGWHVGLGVGVPRVIRSGSVGWH